MKTRSYLFVAVAIVAVALAVFAVAVPEGQGLAALPAADPLQGLEWLALAGLGRLKVKREELQAKQENLHKVFEEAKTDSGELDLDKVKSLGDGLTTLAKAEKIRELNRELDALGKEVETLQAAEDALKSSQERDQKRGSFRHGDPSDPAQQQRKAFKSLGELVTEHKSFKEWHQRGAAGGVTIQLDDVAPSDLMAMAKAFPTMQSKTLFQTTAGWAPESLRIGGFVEAVTRPIQLLDIIPLSRTGFEQIVYMEETTRTHAAAEKAEGVAFAESTFVLTEKSSAVRKVTDSIPVTDEQLEDVAMVESYLNGRLMFGVRQRLDGQVLVGDGTAPNLRGIKNVVGIQTQAKGADPIADAFFKAMTKVRVTGRAQPTHIVIHPTNWESVRLLRTADGLYIWGNPSEPGPDRMWGLPVVQQDADAAGTGYVGSFMPQWITLAERRGVDVQIGYVGTQFTEGKRTMRADGRWAFVVFRPAAFSTVTGL